jgi:hypothetical protein
MRLFVMGLLLVNILCGQIVIVMSKDAAFDTIKKREVERLFLAKSKRLPSGKKAIVVEPKEKQLKSHFYKKVLRKSEIQMRSYWAKMVFTGKGTPPKQVRIEDISAYLASHENAIAYLDKSQVTSELKIIMEIK